MKRIATTLAIVCVLGFVLASGVGAWWIHAHFFSSSNRATQAFATLVPQGPIACPEDPNNLAGIEGWAPGAGHASEAGQTNTGNIGGFAGGLAGGSSETPTPAASACAGLSSDVVARFDRIANSVALLPKDGYDPAARAGELADVTAAFAFVRDMMRTETYAGAMRGASGTLQSHGGSPADKALLLAALLTAKSVPVRFVHNTLAASDAAPIVAAATTGVPAPDDAPASATFDDAFKQLGTDAATAHAGLDAVRKRAEANADAVLSQANNGTNDLLAIAAAGNVHTGDGQIAAAMRAAANLADHWWVQAQQNGAWIDLDPSLTSAKAGDRIGPAPADSPVDALPDSAIRTLTVRFVADQIAVGGSVNTTTLVERTVKLPDTYGGSILASVGDRSIGSDKIAQATSFTPTISVAGDNKDGTAFTTDGLAVVRLQIESALGTTVNKIASRVVIDRRLKDGPVIDPAWTAPRTAAALTSTYSLLVLTGELDPAFAGIHEAAGMQSVRAFMAYAAAGGNGRQLPPSAGIAEPYPLGALHYFETDALFRRRLEEASNGALRFAFDRPQIALERRSFAFIGDKLTGLDAFDIVDNGMAATGSDRAGAVRANLTRGYADTIAEQNLFADSTDNGTIAFFSAAKGAGVATHVLQGPQYGGVALAPVSPVAFNGVQRSGWWQLDPQDGNLVGRMDDGAGQELTEYAIARINDWSTLYSMLQFYGDFFRCIAGAVEAPLAGSGAQASFEKCAASALCNYLEALSAGEAFSRWGTDEEALLYNILDLSGPGKDSWPPSGGAACSGIANAAFP